MTNELKEMHKLVTKLKGDMNKQNTESCKREMIGHI
jgi:hypothetical protein